MSGGEGDPLLVEKGKNNYYCVNQQFLELKELFRMDFFWILVIVTEIDLISAVQID